MSSESAGFKQELPPPGGYQNINYERIKPRRLMKNWMLLSAALAGMVYGSYYYKHRKRYFGKLQVEKFDHIIALEPLLWAERDRDFLKHLRQNREEERELMKDVPGWVLGTIWGEPIFYTLQKDDLPPVSLVEYYAHRHCNDQWEFFNADHFL